MKFFNPAESLRVRQQVTFDEESEVSQEYALECDVTTILNRYQRTGEMPAGRGAGVYDDVSKLCGADYARVRELLTDANNAAIEAQNAEVNLKAQIAQIEASASPPAPAPAPAPSPSV